MVITTIDTRLGHGMATSATHTGADGGAAPVCRAPASGPAPLPSRDRAGSGGQSDVGNPLEAAPGARGAAGPPPPPAERAGLPSHRSPVAPALPPAPARRGGRRLRHRALDAAA